MPMMEILVGPIRSGKSTYSKMRAAQGAIIVNDDAMVMACHGGQYGLFNDGCRPIYKAAEMTIITHALALGKDVVIDRPNYNRAVRRRYIGIAHGFDASVIAVTFPDEGPEEQARMRFEKDSRGLSYEDWVRAARYHADRFEPPCKSEGFAMIVPNWLVAAARQSGRPIDEQLVAAQ